MSLYSVFDFGLENDDPFSTAVEQSLVSAKTNAATKDKKWEQVLGSILKYGGQVVGILSATGVIKNKNLSTVTSGQYDQQALAALLAANGGSIANKEPSQIVIPAQTNTRNAGLDLSNPVILILIIAVVFLLFFAKK